MSIKLGNAEINAISIIEPYGGDTARDADFSIVDEDWVRPSSWLDMPTANSGDGDHIVAGLLMIPSGIPTEVGIYFRGPYVSYNVYPTLATLDWGDGSPIITHSGTDPRSTTSNYIPVRYHTYNFEDLPESTEINYKGSTCRQAVFVADGGASGIGHVNLNLLFGQGGENQNFARYRDSKLVDLLLVGSAMKEIYMGNDDNVRHANLEHAKLDVSGLYPYRCFRGMRSLQKLELNSGVVLTSTDAESFFGGCESLREVPYFDTSNLTVMDNFFSYCRSLKTIPQYDTSNNTNFTNMFIGCHSLEQIPNFDYSNGTNFTGAFQDMKSLVTIDSGVLNLDSMESATNMFYGAKSLVNIPSDFNFTNAISTNVMFRDCLNLRYIPKIDLPNCINPTGMFLNCRSLEKIEIGDLSKATSTRQMFQSCSELKRVTFDNPELISSDYYQMFYDAKLQELPDINYSSGTIFSNTFLGCEFTELPKLNMPNGVYFDGTFSYCGKLKKINGFEPFNNKIISSTQMFRYCYVLREIPSGLFQDYNSCPSYIRWMFNSTYLDKLPDLLNCSGLDNPSTNNSSLFGSIPFDGHVKEIKFGPNSSHIFNGSKIKSLSPTDVSICDDLTNAFAACYNLERCPISGVRASTSFYRCALGSGAIQELFYGLDTVTGKTIDIRENTGINILHPDTIAIATSKGWTVTT